MDSFGLDDDIEWHEMLPVKYKNLILKPTTNEKKFVPCYGGKNVKFTFWSLSFELNVDSHIKC